MKKVLALLLVVASLSVKSQTMNFVNKTSTVENWQSITLLAGKDDVKLFYNDQEKNLQELTLLGSGETKGAPWLKVAFPDSTQYFMVFYPGKLDLTDNKVHQEFILEQNLKKETGNSFSSLDLLGGLFKTMLLGF